MATKHQDSEDAELTRAQEDLRDSLTQCRELVNRTRRKLERQRR